MLKKEYVPPPPAQEKGKGKHGQQKSVAERRAESKSWKLGGTVMTEDELLGRDKDVEKGPLSHLFFFLSSPR